MSARRRCVFAYGIKAFDLDGPAVHDNSKVVSTQVRAGFQPNCVERGDTRQLLRGLVPDFHAARASMAGLHPTESKWLRCQILKKVLVWTPACALYLALGQVASHKRIK